MCSRCANDFVLRIYTNLMNNHIIKFDFFKTNSAALLLYWRPPKMFKPANIHNKTHATLQKRPTTGEIRNGFLLLFPFAPAMRSNVTCKATKSQQQFVLLCFHIGSSSFSLFRSAALSTSFLFPLLLLQVAKGCRSVGAAGLLLPLEAVRPLLGEELL